jgi:hypothetical protein
MTITTKTKKIIAKAWCCNLNIDEKQKQKTLFEHNDS